MIACPAKGDNSRVFDFITIVLSATGLASPVVFRNIGDKSVFV
jgi:hypothetical protein